MRTILLNGEELVCKSITYKETVNAGTDLRPGCVGSAMLTLECFGTQTEAVLAGDELEYYEDETLIGVFYAEPSIKTRNSYTVIAYDNANKLNVDFSAWLRDHQSDFPMTRAALVAAACTIAGVTNATPNWTGSTQTVQAFYADGLTCRDILSYAAELSGFYVHCHENGQLYFHWYTSTPNTRIYPSSGVDGSETRYAYKQDGLNYANYTVPAIDGVAVHPSGEDDVAYIYPASPAGDNLLHIRNNLLLTGAAASVYNAAAQRIYNQMTAVGAYVPATASMFISECPYESGETVLVTDIQGVSFKTIVMSKTVTSSGVVLESTGNEQQDAGAENSRKAIAQLASDIVQIDKLKVGYAEIAQAVIDVLIANDITARNLTIVDEHGNVLATYDANGVTLGQTDETHAELDYNTFELYDKDGNIYVFFGDARTDDNPVTITETYTAVASIDYYYLGFTPSNNNTITVKVNGTATTNYTVHTDSGQTYIKTTVPTQGDTVTVTYKTLDPIYKMAFGGNGATGSYAVALGKSASATASFSAVLSGLRNTASGEASSVSGGFRNIASGMYAFVGGGHSNTASGGRSVVGGGIANKATGITSAVVGGWGNESAGTDSFVGGGSGNKAASQYSAVVGGTNNTANGSATIVGGGQNNTAEDGRNGVFTGHNNSADGLDSAVICGESNTTNGTGQVAWGTYNDPAMNHLEAVGNGTSSARSNARTLDTNGNEWLAGEIDAASGSFRGNVEITGGWFVRRLPASISSGTGYWLVRLTESNGTTGRGGVQFYRSSTYGDGIRISGANVVNGTTISNILALYVDGSGNRSVGISEQAPWRKALSLAYMPGDSFTFGTGSYTIFAGAMRADKLFNFVIPLQKMIDPSVSTITISGQIILVGVNTTSKYKVVTLNDASSAPLDACNTTVINNNAAGITCHCEFAVSQSSWWTAQQPVAVQAYGLTVSFS